MKFFVIAAMVRDEPDIAEWTAYHLAIGAERIMIYDNGSAVPIEKTLKAFVDAGLVTVFRLSNSNHAWVSKDLIARVREPDWASRWVGAIDADEFILPMREDDMKPILERYKSAGIVLNWAMYGSSGHVTRPKTLTIDAYRMRRRNLHSMHKPIFDPHRVSEFADDHDVRFVDGGVAVNELGEVRHGPASRPPVGEIMRINHYFVKSQEDWPLKLARGSNDHSRPKTMEDILRHDAEGNEVRDEVICRFIPKVRETMARYV